MDHSESSACNGGRLARPGRTWRSILSWVPVPVFLAALVAAWAWQPQARHESQAVVSVLYTLFCAAPALLVVWLAGQTFLENGSFRMLLLGVGAVFFAAIYLVSALLLPDYNAGVTVHNTGFLLSGACFLLSGLLAGGRDDVADRRRGLVLGLAYAAAAGGMAAWIWAAYHGRLPTFYVPDAGYTLLRYSVLGLGMAAFALSALWSVRLHLRTGSRFERWFGQSLMLFTIAMVGAVLILAGGTLIAWVARVAQCVAGIYLLLAILSAVEDAGAWRIPLERTIQEHATQYRTLLESISDSFLAMDSQWRLTYINRHALEYAGFAPVEVLGKTIWEAFPAILGTPLEAFYRNAMAAQQAMTYVNPSVVVSGKHFELHAYPAQGGLTVFGQDITARKQAEAHLQQSLREKDVLLKEVHHRVKNNMQVISSLVSLQSDTIDDPALRGIFNDLRDQVRAMALVHDKLYQSASLAHIDFADYAHGLMHYLERAYSSTAADIRLTLAVDPVPMSVETAVPCGLIVNELVTNAYKHAFHDRTSGEITITLQATEDGRVCLSVCDNGIGLPAGLDWQQAPSLGLQLVQMLARQLHGTVEVEIGEGTVVELTFPLPAAQQAVEVSS